MFHKEGREMFTVVVGAAVERERGVFWSESRVTVAQDDQKVVCGDTLKAVLRLL